MQKYGFCFLNVMLLQIVRNAFCGWKWVFRECSLIFCGILVGYFLGEREYFTEYLPHYSNLQAALLADR